MNTFGIQNSYQQFNFQEISVDDLEIISGGSGVSLSFDQGALALMSLGIAAAATGLGVGVGVLAWSIGATMIYASNAATIYYG